ncbi:MAG TPA: MFS transporter, partial [bacterium]|nr:MFS transporter [bacterium]
MKTALPTPASDSTEAAAQAGSAPPKPQGFYDLPRRTVLATLGGVMVAMLMAALDQTIVGTAMPRVIAELHGFEHYAGVLTAYMVASTVAVPISGKLSDLYGRKPFLMGGVLVFILASAACGAAQSMAQLIAFRGVQGLGAGTTQAMAFTTIADLFPPARRGRVSGVMGTVFGLASVIGPAVGGLITDGPGWRYVFYVNVPVGIVALGVLWAFFPMIRQERAMRPRIDYWGALTLTAAVVSLLLAISWGGRDYSWGSPVILALVLGGLVMSGAFLVAEVAAPEPIIPLRLFREPIVGTSLAAAAL